MSKKIKKTIPWFLISAIVISTFSAVLGFKLSEISAESLSTSVTVGNGAPTLSGEAESSVSSGTSPTNAGQVVNFVGAGDDPNSENYYLAICKGNNITAVDGSAPTCDDGDWCISGSTADGVEASCSTTTESSWTESNDWYAFVCDGNAGDAQCSGTSGNQGSGDSGSPFKVNHRPTLTVVSDDDSGDPGDSDFTVTGSTYDDTDSDTAQDTVKLYVCKTAGWSTSTGCVDGWCESSWITPTAALSCDLTIPSPAAHGVDNQTYYTFVEDSHNFPAATSSGAHGSSGAFSVNDVAPTVVSVVLHDGINISIPIKPGDVGVTTTSAVITDNNGCNDITGATSTVYISHYGSDCSADATNCFKITSGDCAQSDCSGGSDAVSTYTCTTTMSYFVSPTDSASGNPWAGYYWNSEITVQDEANYGSGSYTGSAVETNTQTALDISESSIGYGNISAGNNSGDDNATTTIENYGNSPLDADIYADNTLILGGTDWSNVIATSSQKFGLSVFDYNQGGDAVLGDVFSATTTDIVCGKTTSTDTVSDKVSWGLAVPGGTIAGSYSGANAFDAALDSDGWPSL